MGDGWGAVDADLFAVKAVFIRFDVLGAQGVGITTCGLTPDVGAVDTDSGIGIPYIKGFYTL